MGIPEKRPGKETEMRKIAAGLLFFLLSNSWQACAGTAGVNFRGAEYRIASINRMESSDAVASENRDANLSGPRGEAEATAICGKENLRLPAAEILPWDRSLRDDGLTACLRPAAGEEKTLLAAERM